MSTLPPCPIHETNPGWIEECVSPEYKTPEKLEAMTCVGFQKNFPDSYRIVDKGGRGFGFRAPASEVIRGNYRTVLTRRISDILEDGPYVALKEDDPDQYKSADTWPLPQTLATVHTVRKDRPWLGERVVLRVKQSFLDAAGWKPTKGYISALFHLRIFHPDNGYAVIGANENFFHSYLCAVPRQEMIDWINANTDLKV